MFSRSRLLLFTLLSGGLTFGQAFECFSCNAHAGADDSAPCVDQVETCEEGIESCSVVTYTSRADGSQHVRKFCTSPGTPIFQYLLFFPESALCQNIETSQDGRRFPVTRTNDQEFFDSDMPPGDFVGPPASQPPADRQEAPAHRGGRFRRAAAGPPAPPNTHASSLLCVCSTDKCNAGTAQEVLERSLLRRLPAGPPKKPVDEGLQELRA